MRHLGPLLLAALALAGCLFGNGYQVYLLAMVGLTAIVGVGLNVLLGLTGQVSLGHVGFFAIGAYTTAILTLKLGISFWLALVAATLLAGAVGIALALPALRVAGPYLAMVTIAFGFIVENGAIEWRTLTGGSNGLMNIPPPSLFGHAFLTRDIALLSLLLAAGALFAFRQLDRSAWGRAMRAVRASEVASQCLGLSPIAVRIMAFALSAMATGLAGAVFAPLSGFVSPSGFGFFQSILFLLVVIVGGSGTVLGPLVGAAVVVLLPQLLASLAEYQLLFFGAVLLLVLWLAPEGIVGAAARWLGRGAAGAPARAVIDATAFLRARVGTEPLEAQGLAIAFGGVQAVAEVSLVARPGTVTSLIGPNGAGKTTVLNLLNGFYALAAGTVTLGERRLDKLSSHRVARAGIARTFQTSQLFTGLSVLDNVLVALDGHRLGNPIPLRTRGAAEREARALAESLLAFTGYRGPVERAATELAHVDRRLVEIARALAAGPKVLLLDEPAAGLSAKDSERLAQLLRRIAALGIAVLLVEHHMTLVMDVSDTVMVMDAGRCIAVGTSQGVQDDPAVIKAYLGNADFTPTPRAEPLPSGRAAVLGVSGLSAGYDGSEVLKDVGLTVRAGELVAMLGANGAGKSTALRAICGLLRPTAGAIRLGDEDVTGRPAHHMARAGLVLVPEGRQVFPELTVLDNLRLGAYARGDHGLEAKVEAMLARFPALNARRTSRAGLLSGGEQQMLALARGLIAAPRILLLDEPSLGLAPGIISHLFAILSGLRDEGVTLLLVDQMASLALALADRAYVIERGRIVHGGTAAELAGDATLRRAYLGGRQSVESV